MRGVKSARPARLEKRDALKRVLLAIDPGITKVNPTGIAIFSNGVLILRDCLYPDGKGPATRAMSIVEKLDYYIASMGITEVACEEIVHWAGRRNMEGLIVLTREIKALAARSRLLVAFYTPSQWHGRLRREVWTVAIRQEWNLPENTSEHCLAAVGIGAYHLKRMELLK